VSLLIDVDSSVPSSPGLQGSEHTTLTALVTESSLSVSMGTRTTNSGNSGYGSTSTPRLSGVLVTLSGINSGSLSSVLGKVGMNELNNVQSDGGLENSG